MDEVSTGIHLIVFILYIFAFFVCVTVRTHKKGIKKKSLLPLRISFSFRLSTHRASKQRKIMNLMGETT